MFLFVGLHLLEIPGNEGGVAMIVVVAAGRAAVEGRIEIGAPSPKRRTECLSRRIGRLDRCRILGGAMMHFVIGRRAGMHVAMRAVPQHRLVVQIEVGDSAALRKAILGREMIQPVSDKYGCDLSRWYPKAALPAILLPLCSTPLPQSVSHGSVLCWAPYFETL